LLILKVVTNYFLFYPLTSFLTVDFAGHLMGFRFRSSDFKRDIYAGSTRGNVTAHIIGVMAGTRVTVNTTVGDLL
jgi:hypothetical protein